MSRVGRMVLKSKTPQFRGATTDLGVSRSPGHRQDLTSYVEKNGLVRDIAQVSTNLPLDIGRFAQGFA